MKLNNYSHLHKRIAKACNQLALLTKTQLVTDLTDEFEEIRFLDKFGYIVIDFHRCAVYTLGHKLDNIEFMLAQDILVNCDWLETGLHIDKLLKGGK